MKHQSICKVANDDLASTISLANDSVLFMGPGISMKIAEAIANCWLRLDISKVNIILDVEPEIFRLGYGEIEALTFLEEKAREAGTLISHQAGIRIGLLVADDQTIIFSPIPLLIQSESNQNEHPNAIRLNSLPENISKEIGLGINGVIDQTIGLEKAPSDKIKNVAQELRINPPIKFDIARKIQVFNSYFEFVELELKNCSISRKEVPLKSDLFGLAKGDKAHDKLRSSFKLISKDSKFSEKRLMDKKKKITDDYLISLKGYGSVILRTKKAKFEAAINELREEVKKFQESIKDNLTEEMNKSRKTLVSVLYPAVKKKTPERWLKYINSESKQDRDSEIKELLEQEILIAFGSSQDVINEMEVSLIFKGITYELLNTEKFIQVAKKAIPTLKNLHWEKTGALGKL